MDADLISRQLTDLKQAANATLRHLSGRGRDGRTSTELSGAQRFIRHAVIAMREPTVSVEAGFRQRYPHLMRAAVNPAMTTVPGWASELVATDLLDLLATGTPPSLYSQLRGLSALALGLDDVSLKSVPIPVPSANPLAQWVAEGMPAPDLRLNFSSASLGAKKVSCLSVYSGELAKRSTLDVELILGNLLSNDVRRLVDRTLVDALPATIARPAGLLNGVVPIAASAAPDSGQAMVDDLKALVGQILALGGTVPVLMASPLTAISLATLPSTLAIPTIFSPEIAPGTIIAVDAPSFVSMMAAPEISQSNESVVHESDTPLPLASGGGVLATPIRSLWQTNTAGLLVRFDADWTVAGGRVAFISGATW
ncbi:phage major capsid protein [Mesorhizobium qingshengii]|uniref:Phage major capsid protein n=1 Tax=Mesorhizobium qingshengii TaxID=1165689 RepID=A0ABT4R4D5_9HYPH|nr:phage major capsid protein [Mesorhizobium qingshengii]MCZ8548696.1 phage major capsid protein [Mesorhizobium qingshengii]